MATQATVKTLPNGQILVGPVRVGYPYLTKPRKSVINGQTKEKFEAVLLADKATPEIADGLRAAIKAAFVAKFGTEAKLAKDKQPLRDGDASPTEDENDPGKYPGYHFANVSAFPDNPPVLKHADGSIVTDPGAITSGDHVFMVLQPRAYSFENSKGVSLDLRGVRLAKKGDPIGASGAGKAAAMDALDALDIEVAESDEDF